MADFEKDKQRLKEINAELDSRTRRTKVYIALEEEAAEIKKRQLDTQKQLNREFQLGVKAQRQSSAFAEKVKKLEQEKEKSFSSFLQNLAKGNVLQAVGLDKTRKARQKEIDLAKEASELSKEILTSGIKENENRVALQDITKDITEGAITEKNEIRDRINSLGIDDDIRGGLIDKAQELFTSSKATSEATKASAARAAKFSKAIGIGGAAFTALFLIAQKFASSIDAIGKQFGSLNVLGDEFTNELLSSQEAVVGIGASIEDVVATTNELSSEFGLSLDEAANISAQVIDTARAVGLSNEEAAKLSGILQTTSGLSGAQAERLTEGAFQLAAANRVNPSAVLKDMAASSETFAMFSEDGGDNLAKAAVQARALGLSLDTTAKIAEGLLDFEQSITKEVEASVLIGRQLNFQKARELALNNDIEGAISNVVNQLGSEAEFNRLNAIQRKAIADSIGVSVADMAKMVANQEKSDMLAGETAKSFADIIGKDAMSELTATLNELKIFGVAIANTLGPPLMLIAKALNFALVPLGNLVSSISSGIRGVDDFKSGPGGITTMMGPAGIFSLNPRDSVLATTNPIPVNDMQIGPAGSMSPTNSNVNVNLTGVVQGDTVRFLTDVPFDGSNSSTETLATRG
tara:strand:+ start:30 stop:1934 length:1905 start_codon:yes stop_codon:yes gene_type:complete